MVRLRHPLNILIVEVLMLGHKNVIRAFALTLQVWGLFAPKFVFDVVGLIVLDVLICLASHYYCGEVDDDMLRN